MCVGGCAVGVGHVYGGAADGVVLCGGAVGVGHAYGGC